MSRTILSSELEYDVAVDQEGMEFEPAGPLFHRYTLGLTGRLDRRWFACYKKVVSRTPAFSGLRLDPAASTISFTCRSTDGPSSVLSVTRRIEELLLDVNQAAFLAGTRELESNPPPADRLAGNDRRGSIVSTLLSRLTGSSDSE